MESWLLATIPFVFAVLRATVRSEKSRARLKEAAFSAYVTILAIWPEFAANPVTAVQQKKILGKLPKVA